MGRKSTRDLVCEILDRWEAEGERVLERACREHPDDAPKLRARISSLRELGLLPVHRPPIPDRVGDFELIERVGAGGMGLVYRARQGSLGRDVAVKLIRPEWSDRPAVRERFRREVEVLATLSHPSIVPVHVVGDEDGLPYFAMKLVEGRTLARRLRDRSGPDEGLHDYLIVFEAVCHAIAYAHAKGVLHRDLKPSNVMVGAFGETQVMDWGLAKRLEDEDGERSAEDFWSRGEVPSSHSRSGSVFGTPQYMSPEQARGELSSLDRRSDVFSLGAMLAEILTGRPPYADRDTGALEAAEEARLEPCLARIAQVQDAARQGLAELATRCLQVRPEDRPGDAAEVAAAVARWRAEAEERAQQARLDAAAASVRFEAERRTHRLRLALVAAVVLLGLGGGASWWWIDRQDSQRQRAAEHEVRRALDVARAAWLHPEADHSAAVWARAVVAAESAASLVSTTPGCDPELIREVDRALQEASRREQELRERQDRQQANARLLARLDRVRIPADDVVYDGGFKKIRHLALDRDYRALFQELGVRPDEDDPAWVAQQLRARRLDAQLAAALDDWALSLQHNLAEESRWRRRFALAARLDGDALRCALRDTLAESLDGCARLRERFLAEDRSQWSPQSLDLLARGLQAGGDWSSAELVLNSARRVHPGDFALAYELAFLLERVRRPADAYVHYKAAHALRPDNDELLHRLGIVCEQTGRYTESAEIFESMGRERPDDPHPRSHIISARKHLNDDAAVLVACEELLRLEPGDAYARVSMVGPLLRRGEAEEAERRVREVLAENDRQPEALAALAGIQRARGELDAAARTAETMLRLAPENALGWSETARNRLAQGDEEGAREAAAKAIERAPGQASVHIRHAQLLERLGDMRGAEAAYRNALELHPDDADLLLKLGGIVADLGHPEQAERLLHRCLRMRPDSAPARTMLGRIELARGRLAEARAWIEAALAHDDSFPQAWHSYAVVLGHEGEIEESLRAAERAAALDPGNPRVWYNCGDARQLAGDLPGAIEAFERCVRLQPNFAAGWRRLGGARSRGGDWESATEAFEQALRHDDDDATNWFNVGRGSYELRRDERAAEAYRAGLERRPQYAEGHADLGVVLRRLGRVDEALDAWNTALELKPDHGGCRWNRGSVRVARAQWASGLEDLRLAVPHFEEAAALHNELAWWLSVCPEEEHRDGEVALRHARRAVELHRSDANLWHTLATARMRQGDAEGSLEALSTAQGLDGQVDDWDRIVELWARSELGAEPAVLDDLRERCRASDLRRRDAAFRVLLEEIEGLSPGAASVDNG